MGREMVQENQGKRKRSRIKLLTRTTAAVLAVIMILSTVLYSISQVSLNAENYLEKDYRLAARELMKENEYADSSRLSQMTAFARDLLSGRHTFEDVELGVQISVAQGKFDEAIALTEKSISLYDGENETKGKLYLRLGYLYVMQNDPENAYYWLNRGIALAPSPEAYLTRAQVELDLGDTEMAMMDAAVYQKATGDSGELLADMVNIYEAAGEFDTAARMYTILIDDTGSSEYMLSRAYCYTNLGRMEEAAEDRDRYASAGGAEIGNADVMLGLGWMRAKEYAKANDCFVRAIDEDYADPESLYSYVVLCSYMTKNYERACTYGDRLIDRIRKSGKDTEAEITVEKRTGRLMVTLVKINMAEIYRMNGASHMSMGNYERAAERLTAWLAETPDEVYAYYLRGTALLALNRYGEAEKDFTAAITANMEPAGSHYSRGICRMETGNREGALEDFEWVVDSEDPELFTEAAEQIRLLNESGGAEPAEGAENTEISGS